MNQYTSQQKKTLLSITIEDIIRSSGKSIEHTSGNLYFSPFRNETSQSFHIDNEHNRWYDFGTGEGGGLIDFVCKFYSCPRWQAYDKLADVKEKLDKIVITKQKFSSPVKKSSKIIIDKVENNFTDTALIEYARKRGISAEILNKYCKQVSYHIQDYKIRKTIGFANNDGGYVFRSNNTKRCTNSSITTFVIQKENEKHSHCDKVLVFEGFFDFLSYLVLQENLNPQYDVCVLNSTVNLPSALAFILQHKKIAVFFDNDPTGQNALDIIIKKIEARHDTQYEIYDMSALYKKYNDLNEYLSQTIIKC